MHFIASLIRIKESLMTSITAADLTNPIKDHQHIIDDRNLNPLKYTCGHIILREPILRPCKDTYSVEKDNNFGSQSIKAPCNACLA